MQFLHDTMNFIEGLVVGLIVYSPLMRYVLKPIGYQLWDDVKALWSKVIKKEQELVQSVVNG